MDSTSKHHRRKRCRQLTTCNNNGYSTLEITLAHFPIACHTIHSNAFRKSKPQTQYSAPISAIKKEHAHHTHISIHTHIKANMEYVIESNEAIHAKFVNHINKPNIDPIIHEADITHFTAIIRELIASSSNERVMAIKPKGMKNSYFLKIGRILCERGTLTPPELQLLEERLRVHRGKSHSGVLVITIFTSPLPTYTNELGETVTQKFSCKWNCYYCPNQPGQPRSYLEGEPGVLRANKYKFDCKQQMWGRMENLFDTGHPVDKLEVLVLGGTWESYPEPYRNEFVRDMYYAANTFCVESSARRPPRSLHDERTENKTAMCKVIGLTLETRPDTVTPAMLTTLRDYGCTRVQIGIQHLDDAILKKVNRKCTYAQTVQAIRLLKDWGYKIDAHYMPNLPGATPAADRVMLVDQLLGTQNITQAHTTHNFLHERTIVTHPDLQVDQWKVYPCETTPHTVIEQWHKNKQYMPYDESELTPILLDMKAAVFPWIRLNRIVRDIPSDYIIASGDRPNLRQDLQILLKRRHQRCRCIRCREVKLAHYDPETSHIMVREYNASGGTEYFISAEHKDPSKETLYGFIRLRVPSTITPTPHPSIHDHTWIRELHVYGKLQKTVEQPATTAASDNSHSSRTQHTGLGKQLLAIAEDMSWELGKTQILVIAGEGTKAYYEKQGYHETVLGYMVKQKTM